MSKVSRTFTTETTAMKKKIFLAGWLVLKPGNLYQAFLYNAQNKIIFLAALQQHKFVID